jgi:uncharacterized protein YcgI (DUF1989 family)
MRGGSVKKVEGFAIPKGSGKAFVVQKGQVLRISQPEGPAVVDFNAFNADNPRECLGSSVTRTEEGIHVSTGSHLWSCPPWERFMFTVLADTVKHQPSSNGAKSHDFVFGRCSKARRIRRYGSDTPGCQEILAAAIEAFGLAADCVHDPFNVFMKTGLDKSGRIFYEEPDARKGDYIDLRTEMTCIAAISACPGMSSGPVPLPYSVGVEIYEI